MRRGEKEKRKCAMMMESLVIMLPFSLLSHTLFLMRGGESTVFLLAFGPCFFLLAWEDLLGVPDVPCLLSLFVLCRSYQRRIRSM